MKKRQNYQNNPHHMRFVNRNNFFVSFYHILSIIFFITSSTSAFHSSNLGKNSIHLNYHKKLTQTPYHGIFHSNLFFHSYKKRSDAKCKQIYIWKPPDDGGRRGYYNLNERGDFDPDKRKRIRRKMKQRGKRFGLFTIKDLIIPKQWPSTLTLQSTIIYLNILFFMYQLVSASWYTPQLNNALSQSGYAGQPLSILQILQRNILGGSSLVVRAPSNHLLRPIIASSSGPFTMDFMFIPTFAKFQPHRYLTAGFLHGSLLHLFFNMRYFTKLPLWLEYGLGKSLYFITYATSIITGNIAHYLSETNASACLGASGGICGLNGLMFVLYRKMNRPQQSWAIFRNMALLLFFGMVEPSISNASHIGGFLGGLLVGILCSPNFRKSYMAKRKVWFTDYSNDRMRQIMGPNLVETPPLLDLRLFIGGILLLLWYKVSLKDIPFMIWKGISRPGSLSGMM